MRDFREARGYVSATGAGTVLACASTRVPQLPRLKRRAGSERMSACAVRAARTIRHALLFREQANRLRGGAFTATFIAKMFGGRGLNSNVIYIKL